MADQRPAESGRYTLHGAAETYAQLEGLRRLSDRGRFITTQSDVTGEQSGAPANRRIRLLYLMHVDWNWIWQRPQAIAEELVADGRFSVRVAYLPNWRRRRLIPNASSVQRQAIWQMPFGRVGVIRAINRCLVRASLRLLAKRFKPDTVLITYPTLLSVLPSGLARLPLFYDCMDLASGFASGPADVERLHRIEDLVIERSAGVFVSSEFIGDTVRSRHVASRPVLVRNGFGGIGSLGIADEPSRFEDPGRLVRLGYFGTVSTWFDSRLVIDALVAHPRLEVHVWGPLVAVLPQHRRLFVHAAVSHGHLAAAVREVDALIMPFVLSDLVRGVDPVKLYEYVALGKPVLSVHYPELDQFTGLVHFYDGKAELDVLLDRLRDSRNAMRPDPVAARSFLDAATWHSRAAIIADEIDRALGRDAPGPPDRV